MEVSEAFPRRRALRCAEVRVHPGTMLGYGSEVMMQRGCCPRWQQGLRRPREGVVVKGEAGLPWRWQRGVKQGPVQRPPKAARQVEVVELFIEVVQGCSRRGHNGGVVCCDIVSGVCNIVSRSRWAYIPMFSLKGLGAKTSPTPIRPVGFVANGLCR